MKKLLPVGFYDLLFDEAEKNHQNSNNALQIFFSKGYRLIKTPLVEFEGNASCQSKNAFRATDVISGDNIIFRNDITLQIERLLQTRLKNEKLPLKLCYLGDVLYAKNNELYANRQQTQVGLEIIGASENSNFEIVETTLAALEKMESKDLLIEFSLPDLLEIFLDEVGLANSEKLREAILKKNSSLIKKLAPEHAEIISEIALSNHNLEELLAKVAAEINSSKISQELEKAQKISQYFSDQNFPNVKLRFDLFGDHKSSYHNEIAFDIFSGDFPYPVARGGKYQINNVSAVGATIYMNYLLLA